MARPKTDLYPLPVHRHVHWMYGPLNQRTTLYAGPKGRGAARHEYKGFIDLAGTDYHRDEQLLLNAPTEPFREVLSVTFQHGPPDKATSTPGVLDAALLAVVLDRLRDFQNSLNHSCRENALAITHLETAMHWLGARTDRQKLEQGRMGTP